MNEKNMQINDEKLSAFLDAELPEAEMEMIREQLLEDENLANRLADLAMVDELVAMSYVRIDSHPLPEKITNLLSENKLGKSQVIAFPLLRKFQSNIQRNMAIAASVALVIGFGMTQLSQSGNNDWQAVAQILEQAPSGVEQAFNNGAHVKPRLTFMNKEGEYCRQFIMVNPKGASENIACRKNNSWKLAETIAVNKAPDSGEYQTATGGSVLDEKIEQMASGDFFDAQAESEIINQHWAK